MTVKTRVAPSPTGDPHLGTAYMALFCLAHARKSGGKFVLRIEDTDLVRSTRASEETILNSLKWLGLEWDEGPDVGGPNGPYRQSERQEIYQEYADKLLDAGHAFHCFCTPERLDEMRASQREAGETARYDGRCMSISREEAQQRIDAGEKHVVRMKVPTEGTCVVHDELRGDIEIDWRQVDMQVLVKTDGFPTYHLAVVVDDHLMEITDIIRGEEWINSAPKHILLYEYFGWEMPRLIHMPLLRNPDKSKLSKRKNPTSINFYKDMGFLPEAVVNYLGMLGWSMPDESEKFTLDEMVQNFDINRISLGAPVFDIEKLRWLNGRWIREDLSPDDFTDRLINWSFSREKLRQIVPLIQDRADVMSDVAPMINFLFEGFPALSAEDFKHKKLEEDDVKKVLQFTLWRLEAHTSWDRDSLNEVMVAQAELMELKIRDYLAPLFMALAGASVSPPLFDSMVILGPDMVKARIRYALDCLGGVSKKQAKRLEKEYQSLVK